MALRLLSPGRLLIKEGARWKVTSRLSPLTPFLGRGQYIQPLRCLNVRRTFSITSILCKKGQKAGKKEANSSAEGNGVEVEDPLDLSSLEAGIEKALTKLQDDLSKLRTGGRFNPELLENVRVYLKKDSKASFRLGELAQVIPKGGRSISILVGETDHVKPITSAIQASRDLNLQPQPDPHNARQLTIAIPPPTRESREQALGAAGKAGEVASVGVRNARAAMQKRLKLLEQKKVARPDDAKKAHQKMEKVVEKGNADVKKAVEAARKGMEQS